MPLWSPATTLLIEEAALLQGRGTQWLAARCGIAESTLKGALARRGAVSHDVHNRAMEALGLESAPNPFDNDPHAGKPDSPSPTGPRCPTCNAPVRLERYQSQRLVDGKPRRYQVTQQHCPNNKRPVRGVAMAKGFKPCPIHRIEEEIAHEFA